MQASQLWYPFKLEHKFCIFNVLKVSEILRNTPKHHFGSNGVEWMLHNIGNPNFGSNGVEWTLHNFRSSEIVHLGTKHWFCFFLHARC
jgi:hypothetical protein